MLIGLSISLACRKSSNLFIWHSIQLSDKVRVHMQVKREKLNDTKSKLTIIASDSELAPLKDHVLTHFKNSVKVPGFRPGNIPAAILEKHVDPTRLQEEFLSEAVEQLYVTAVNNERLRPVGQPQVSIIKFVPFTTLEFSVEINVVGDVKLPDYTKMKKTKNKVEIGEKEVKGVLASLQKRMAEKKEVVRPAKNGDELLIDFNGADDKGQPIKGADGKDYPLILGSNTFIPGFEPNLVGLKTGESKTFDLTFPKDYGVKALASKKVTFVVNISKVQELIEPKLDDDFAAKAGPFKSMQELKADIKKQLEHERGHEAKSNFEGEIIRDITAKSSVAIPDELVNDQMERDLTELRQNLTYRGQTYEEFLESEVTTEEDYRKNVLKPNAAERVKAGLVLAEIADKEKLEVTPEELEIRIQVLKGQYKDKTMQEELDKPENRRDIAARLLTEKTIAKLADYAAS